jgi:MFS family permease
MNLQKPDQ